MQTSTCNNCEKWHGNGGTCYPDPQTYWKIRAGELWCTLYTQMEEEKTYKEKEVLEIIDTILDVTDDICGFCLKYKEEDCDEATDCSRILLSAIQKFLEEQNG